MPLTHRIIKKATWTLALCLFGGSLAVTALAQAPPYYPPADLDNLVGRIALYPDSLLGQVLAAATFSDQIPDAANWADGHHYLTGAALADAIQADMLPWDPSVQALLPFPSVLEMMASDMNWTQALGNAFLAQEPDVMAAVQRERQKAYQYGYLRTNPQIVVTPGSYIAIAPVNPAFIVLPVYDPLLVYAAPRPGFFVGGAIRFGFGVTIGGFFRPWGWGVSHINWGERAVFIDNARWGRTWANRGTYSHPYPNLHREIPPRPGPGGSVARGGGERREAPVPPRVPPGTETRGGETRGQPAPQRVPPGSAARGPEGRGQANRPAPVEQHQLHGRSQAEKQAPREGKGQPKEEHHR